MCPPQIDCQRPCARLQEHRVREEDVQKLSRSQFLCPGFIDTHVHAPQVRLTTFLHALLTHAPGSCILLLQRTAAANAMCTGCMSEQQQLYCATARLCARSLHTLVLARTYHCMVQQARDGYNHTHFPPRKVSVTLVLRCQCTNGELECV
jgi:hypothetical protein